LDSAILFCGGSIHFYSDWLAEGTVAVNDAKTQTTVPNIPGIMNERDRRWRITRDGFEGYMTDYNWEITGATPNVEELDSDIRFSHSAWYWTAELRRRGYQVDDLGCVR
jgi:hypothetical protein